jgi:hypothetical protein
MPPRMEAKGSTSRPRTGRCDRPDRASRTSTASRAGTRAHSPSGWARASTAPSSSATLVAVALVAEPGDGDVAAPGQDGAGDHVHRGIGERRQHGFQLGRVRRVVNVEEEDETVSGLRRTHVPRPGQRSSGAPASRPSSAVSDGAARRRPTCTGCPRRCRQGRGPRPWSLPMPRTRSHEMAETSTSSPARPPQWLAATRSRNARGARS